MANTLMNKGREQFGKAGINWTSDAIKVALMTTAYSFPGAGGASWLSDIGTVLATSGNLASCTMVGGIAGAANLVGASGIGPIASGSTVGGLYIYKDTGTGSTSPLIAWFDTNGAGSAISVPTNGGTIEITWATTGNQIFAI